MRRDPYEVLGVSRDAEDGHIKRSFRKLARELHPDVNRHDPEAEEKFKEAAEAYEILSDPERRATYDRYGFEGLDSRGFASQAHGFGSFADIFDAFFGGDPFGGSFGRSSGRVQGGDLAVEVEISLEEAARGVEAEVAYELVDTCEHCHGNGAEPGTPIETCERCGGDGAAARRHAHRVRPARPRAGLRRLRRRRPRAGAALLRVPGARPARRAQDAQGRRPRRDRRRAAHPAQRPRQRRRARWAAGRPVRARARRRGRALPARRQRPRDGRRRTRAGGGARLERDRADARRRRGRRGRRPAPSPAPS